MSAQAAATHETGRPLKRHVAAVVVGNALEFYDFLTYSFFAIYIGQTFFPSSNPASSLLASLATFGAGFATRPLGGLILGMLGDRWGRKPAMFISFSLMGLGMLGVVFTPGYAAIGIAAPILLICFRLIQGFALGGEVGPTTAFLIEAPPPGMRGFYGSLQSASQYAATFVAGCVGTGLAAALDPVAMQQWGWRAAFLAGALIIPFGLMVRRSLPETMHNQADLPDTQAPKGSAWGIAALGLMLLGGGTIATYVILYLGTYAQSSLHMAPLWAFGATLCIGIGGVVGAPLGGWISDRVGRKPVMLSTLIVLALATVPAFIVLNAWPVGPAASLHRLSAHLPARQRRWRRHHDDPRAIAGAHPLGRHVGDLCAGHRRVRRQRAIHRRMAQPDAERFHGAGLLHDGGRVRQPDRDRPDAGIRAGAEDRVSTAAPRTRVPLRHVVAVFVGNGLEFYDFLTFSYFSVYIARSFFPQDNPSAALLATLATFGAGLHHAAHRRHLHRAHGRSHRPQAGHADHLFADGPGHHRPGA